MHEIFLSTYVPNEELDRALCILYGYCGMEPEVLLRRRLIWEGPRSRVLKGIDPTFIARQSPTRLPLWKSLHDQLIRQSYVITLIYEVSRDQFRQPEIIGGEAQPAVEGPLLDCDELPGILRWSDLPDPSGGRPVNSRLAISIENEKSLCSILKSMGHRFTGEVVQEGYQFVHGNVIFSLSRYLEIPTALQEKGGNKKPIVNSRMPAFESLTPFDSENKWILAARIEVFNGNDPDQMQRGIEQLATIKTEFEGCFDFQAIDRHTFDTRVKF